MNSKCFAIRAQRKDPSTKVVSDKFGGLILGDHIILGKDSDQGLDGEKVVCNLVDDATGYRAFEPVASKSTADCIAVFKDVVGHQNKVKTFCSDNSRELKRMASELEGEHPTSAPYRHTSNARMERLNRDATEGCRAALYQSGFSRLPRRTRAVRRRPPGFFLNFK